jgi:subtilisin family serine protease
MKSSFILLILFSLFGCNKTGKVNYRTIESNDVIDSNDSVADNQDQNTNGSSNGSGNGNSDGSGVQTDPLTVFQWHLENTGQTTFSTSGGTEGEDINLSLSSPYKGAGVLVAVSDNAVQVSHEDLSLNALAGTHKNYFLSSPYTGDPSPTDDDDAHGTAVAGIILASANNGVGGRGIAPSASLAGFKFIGSSITTSKLIDQANGIYDIFNYSYGGYSCYTSTIPSSYLAQLEYGVNNLRNQKGAIYVKAAGNEYYAPLEDCYEDIEGSPYYFGNAALEEDQSYPYYILVGALDSDGTSAFYSSPGSSVWISAPGGDFGTNSPAILTTDIMGCSKGSSITSAYENDFESGGTLNTNCNYTSTMNGTSSSAPMVSGVVATMLSANPNLSWRDVKYILAATARQVHSSSFSLNHPTGDNLSGHTYMQGWRTNSAGFKFHNWYGFGAVDADAALAMALSYNSSWGALVTHTKSSSNISLSIPDNSATGVSHLLSVSQSISLEAVQITVDIEHDHIGDLGIELTSPAGTKSQLMLINSGLIQEDMNDTILLSNAFYLESSQGQWTIKVVDGDADVTGSLKNWSIKVWGH